VQLGVYVNADDIEKELVFSNSLNFTKYQLTVPENQLRHFFKESTSSPVKRHEPDLWGKLSVDQNDLKIDTKVDSYLAADIAEFIRQQLLVAGISFTYETVMSHPGKIDFFQQALIKNYRVYLYYIATEDPDININRGNVRVAQNGHPVSPDVIRNRYYKSLQNLKNAVKQTNRAYIFDSPL
jgi:predicted ABC-type ATPase